MVGEGNSELVGMGNRNNVENLVWGAQARGSKGSDGSSIERKEGGTIIPKRKTRERT